MSEPTPTPKPKRQRRKVTKPQLPVMRNTRAAQTSVQLGYQQLALIDLIAEYESVKRGTVIRRLISAWLGTTDAIEYIRFIKEEIDDGWFTPAGGTEDDDEDE
jgi:hypothetical protein